MSALFAALIIVGAYIKIPVPLCRLPFRHCLLCFRDLFSAQGRNAQRIGICCSALRGFRVCGRKRRNRKCAYASFGYIIGFAVGAFVSGLIASNSSYPRLLGASFAAMGIIYFFGMLYYYLMKVFYLGDGIEIKTSYSAFSF